MLGHTEFDEAFVHHSFEEANEDYLYSRMLTMSAGKFFNVLPLILTISAGKFVKVVTQDFLSMWTKDGKHPHWKSSFRS